MQLLILDRPGNRDDAKDIARAVQVTFDKISQECGKDQHIESKVHVYPGDGTRYVSFPPIFKLVPISDPEYL